MVYTAGVHKAAHSAAPLMPFHLFVAKAYVKCMATTIFSVPVRGRGTEVEENRVIWRGKWHQKLCYMSYRIT